MRITPDSGLLQALSRLQDGQKAAERARFEESRAGRGPQTATDSAARTSALRQVAATLKTEAPADRHAKFVSDQAADRADGQRFAREAPARQRPKYIPKGQTLNILV